MGGVSSGTLAAGFIGRALYKGGAAWKALTALPEPLRLCMNLFQPTLKRIGEVQVGGKGRKRYDTARPLTGARWSIRRSVLRPRRSPVPI